MLLSLAFVTIIQLDSVNSTSLSVVNTAQFGPHSPRVFPFSTLSFIDGCSLLAPVDTCHMPKPINSYSLNSVSNNYAMLGTP